MKHQSASEEKAPVCSVLSVVLSVSVVSLPDPPFNFGVRFDSTPEFGFIKRFDRAIFDLQIAPGGFSKKIVGCGACFHAAQQFTGQFKARAPRELEGKILNLGGGTHIGRNA